MKIMFYQNMLMMMLYGRGVMSLGQIHILCNFSDGQQIPIIKTFDCGKNRWYLFSFGFEVEMIGVALIIFCFGSKDLFK